jgi:hypothetical protein
MVTRRSGGPVKGKVLSTPQGVEPLGTVRRSQLISTYGIGAVVDLEKGSFMPMGLDDWEGATGLPSLTIHEPRLQAQLGVDHFRLAPVVKAIKGTSLVEQRPTLPAVRFPRWHECPKCHRIGTEEDPFELAPDLSRLKCVHCKTFATPVRFIVACRSGHIDEFPWVEWAHRKHEIGICTRPALKLLSSGRSAALGDLYLHCKCGASNSLGEAFQPNVLGRSCSGFQPWLHAREAGCSAELRVLQRGASNVHFAVGASALSIPPVSDVAFQVIDEQWIALGGLPPEAIETVIRHVATQYGVPFDALLSAYRERKRVAEPSAHSTEGDSRAEEYAALSADRDDQDMGAFKSQFCNSVSEPPDLLRPWFDLVGAVSRLREVRVMAGFSRIEPYPVRAERIALAVLEGKVSKLSKRPRNWLPASEIRGEGLFLRFDEEAVERWIGDNPAVAIRAASLEAVSAAVAAKRGYERDYTITPRLLLVHTFAHALIRQISLDCGYSSAALRERLYVAEATENRAAMQGVLVYTGSPDSEGSLGGLVRLADPELLLEIVNQALRGAHWCGSDPVCLETDPRQSGERISGAACHCCVLLPETACEKFNRELDRSLLVGDAEKKWQGYFDGVET